jgi:predicted regulator of Ras-like GTPase activity (Roadblock/LC7/MglB family)
MSAMQRGQYTVETRLQREFRQIKANVVGVHGTVVATSDGFLVAHDVPDLDPTDLAALLAASRALASQGIAATGRGQFKEAITRGTDGYLAVYAAGSNAIVAVIGGPELNVGLLHLLVHDSIERIASYTAEFGRWTAAPSQNTVPAGRGASDGTTSGLPVRRRRA